MAPSEKQILLLTIPFSHYAEKARWVLQYYKVPHRERLLMPGFHIPVVKSYTKHMSKEDVDARTPGESATEIPILVVYDSTGTTIEKVIQGSQKIVQFVSSQFSSPSTPNIYETCGIEQAAEIRRLESRYDNELGVASRGFAYWDMLVRNRWGSIIPFAMVSFQNPVGWLQSMGWPLFSQLFRVVVLRFYKLNEEKVQSGVENCRVIFREASEILEQSPYLGGDAFSAADIAFAALAYPIVAIMHEDGFTYYPPSRSCFSSVGKAVHEEFRATKAGQHVFRIYAEKKALR